MLNPGMLGSSLLEGKALLPRCPEDTPVVGDSKSWARRRCQAYQNLFSPTEVFQLQEYFCSVPASSTSAIMEDYSVAVNKNLDYHIPGSFARSIIKPKMDSIFGTDHECRGGSYKEISKPHPTHIDNDAFHQPIAHLFTTTNRCYEAMVIVPLMSHPEARTVFFDIFDDRDPGVGTLMPEHWLGHENGLPIEWFSHMEDAVAKQCQHLPVDQVINWHAGDAIVWGVDQLHCSTDYRPYQLTKKFIFLMIA